MKYKYPRTLHFPFSPGATSDDKMLSEEEVIRNFEGKCCIITEKMDGENTTMYSDYIHARSLDSKHHSSRNWVKRFHAEIAHEIPDGWRICGENLFAEHSISYDNLDSYFYGFSIWDDNNICQSWAFTQAYFTCLGIQSVPTLRQVDDVNSQKSLDFLDQYGRKLTKEGKEGFVLRNEDEFSYQDFKYNVAKYVRPNHVTTDNHWMHSEVVPNKLRG